MFKEDGKNVEALVDLAISIDEVWVVHCQNVIDANVNVNARQTILIFQKWNFYGRNIAQSALPGDLLDDLTTMFDQLVLIVGHPTVEHNHNVYITAADCPQPVHTRSRGRYSYFSL